MRRLRGLAFIELLVIVAVIAILAAIALPSYNNYTSRYAKCKAGARDGYAIVPLVFGSDRNVLRSDGSRIRFGSAQGELVYGTTDVSVPCRHAMGAMEVPRWYRFEFQEDPDKHIVIKDVELLEEEAFVQRLQGVGSGSALLFVHGYNTSFDEAARRTAQLAFDLKFDGIAGFFSWPSTEKVVGYTVDKQNVEWSRVNLETFLETVLRGAKPDSVVIIAHSMGSWSVTHAVKEIAKREPALAANIRELILAAPDIDRGIFLRDIAPTFKAFGNKPTVYVSDNDLALTASRGLQGGVRVGDASQGIVASEFFDTIDASAVDTSLLGHSYYGRDVSMIADIDDVLRTRRDPADRLLLEPGDAESSYWRFRKQRK